jgi:segregation and condensation protein B
MPGRHFMLTNSLLKRPCSPTRPQGLPRNRSLPPVYRVLGEDGHEEIGEGELGRDTVLARVEAALMAAGEPLTPRRLAVVADLPDAAAAREYVQRLQAFYEMDGSAFQVEEFAGGYQLLTRPEYHPWLARVRRLNVDLRLSMSARETLAIVAYRQPISRAEVEAIRGVQCSEMLRQLMEKGLLRIAGRDESLGRPVLYGTTRRFLQCFGLKDLRELPQAKELTAAEPGHRKKSGRKAKEGKSDEDGE